MHLEGQDYKDEELIDETSKRRVLKNVEFRQGTYGAHMAEETTPWPLVFFKSLIHKKYDIVSWLAF